MATPGPGNWVHEKGGVTDKDIKALEKAKRIEARLERHGYKWIRVNPRVTILVPCDKKGNPTEEGLRKIELLKKAL
jgi:hypothetical protein